MKIDLFEISVLNMILIIFPILLYLVYSFCNNKKENKSIFLNIALFTSLYLCLRFGIKNDNSKLLLFCNIPIIIAYVKKQTVTGIILSMINIIICLKFNISVNFIVIKYVLYFALYLIGRKKKITNDSYMLSVAVVQAFFLAFEYFFSVKKVDMNDLTFVIIIVFIYYFITCLILFLFRIIDKVQTINDTILKLKKDQKVKDALFKLTHEIKNPLAVCKGYIDMIDLEKKDKTIKYLNIIEEEINRSLNIIADFSEMNKIQINKQRININCLLDDVYESFNMLAKSNHINLDYIENKNDIYIEIDAERIKQVMINVLKNSIEAIKEKGNIKISSNICKKYIDIVIKDDGVGMSKEDLERLKEMFFTTKRNGTGLGVALSNEIMLAHGGNLIYSSKIGEGTTTTIRIPFTN